MCLKWHSQIKRKVVHILASTKKFTHDAMSDQNGHVDREHDSPQNTDIDSKKSHLNYSFPMSYDGMKPFQYYKQRVGEVYMYGRGSKREKKAITGAGWIVTLPKELYGKPEKEKAFFQGCYQFISNRYGAENIINNSIHYDEGGLPHIHVIFAPITTLDHDIVQYKTKRAQTGVQLPSGRWEYQYIHVDKKGREVNESDPSSWVKLNNYSRMSDYYDEKVDCNTVLNPIELRHFHSDLQNFLTKNGIEGKVITGKTGTNFTVKELKDFTQKTGMHLDEVKEMMENDKSLLQSFVEKDAKVVNLEELLQQKDKIIESLKEELLTKTNLEPKLEITQKEDQIKVLSQSLSEKNQELSITTDYTKTLEKRISEMEKTLAAKQTELDQSNAKIKELEQDRTQKQQAEKAQGWGHTSSNWGEKSQSGWGTKNTSFEEEKTW